MAPDLNYNSNNRCSITAHVPSSSSSSSNCKSVKCTSVFQNDVVGYNNNNLNNNQSTNNNNNLNNKNKCLDCKTNCTENGCMNSSNNNNCNNNYNHNFNNYNHLSNKDATACCSVQHESKSNRRNQIKPNNQKNFKSSLNEFNVQPTNLKAYYTHRNEKCNESKLNDKLIDCNDKHLNHQFNERYPEKYERCCNEKFNNDRCNNKLEKYGDKLADKCVDRFDKQNEKCPEKYPNNNQIDKYHHEKCIEKINYDKNSIDKQNEKQQTDKQLMDTNKQLNDELTSYEKVMLSLKKRARHRIERKTEEDLNPYVGMYRLRKEIGNGNFSQVYIGNHCLTKGKFDQSFFFLLLIFLHSNF